MWERVVGQLQENSEFQEQGQELILALVHDRGFSTGKEHTQTCFQKMALGDGEQEDL